MVTFPVQLSAEVLSRHTTFRFIISVSEAAMPPGRKPITPQAVRILGAAAARMIVARHYPDHASSMAIPLPAVMEIPLGVMAGEQPIWDDAGVTVWLWNGLSSVPAA